MNQTTRPASALSTLGHEGAHCWGDLIEPRQEPRPRRIELERRDVPHGELVLRHRGGIREVWVRVTDADRRNYAAPIGRAQQPAVLNHLGQVRRQPLPPEVKARTENR